MTWPFFRSDDIDYEVRQALESALIELIKDHEREKCQGAWLKDCSVCDSLYGDPKVGRDLHFKQTMLP